MNLTQAPYREHTPAFTGVQDPSESESDSTSFYTQAVSAPALDGSSFVGLLSLQGKCRGNGD